MYYHIVQIFDEGKYWIYTEKNFTNKMRMSKKNSLDTVKKAQTSKVETIGIMQIY